MRVIVRLPYNRPEDPPPDPPRVRRSAFPPVCTLITHGSPGRMDTGEGTYALGGRRQVQRNQGRYHGL